jgi:pimeloyl-ACP methyl ester carboxylesterase
MTWNPDDMLTFDRGDGHLRYAVAGEGDPVVFIHGFGLDSDMWAPQWPVFAGADPNPDAHGGSYRTIRCDLRGYGRSSLPQGPYSHVDDVIALMDHLECRSAHLVGLSMGGRYALRIARAAPAAVRSLTLADTALDGHVWSADWLNRWRVISEAAKSGDFATARRHWMSHPLFEPALEQPKTSAALEVMVARYSGWHWWQRDPDPAPSPPIAQTLSSIDIPTLMIVGERDLPDFQDIARRVAAGMPNVQLATVADAGHMSNMEAPEEFNRLVLDHLARHQLRRLN